MERQTDRQTPKAQKRTEKARTTATTNNQAAAAAVDGVGFSRRA